jgi:succinate dehydrogenase / fumarate reductase cytochrome b subunit
MLGLVWALLALAAGPERWATFAACAGSPFGMLVLLGFSWALAYHLVNGIRHLVQDAGLGFSIPEFVRSSWLSVIGSLVLVALVWSVVLAHWGHA